MSLMTSARHTAVVEKYRSPVEMVRVYLRATVYVAATRVITLRQYSLKSRPTVSEDKHEFYISGSLTAFTKNINVF